MVCEGLGEVEGKDTKERVITEVGDLALLEDITKKAEGVVDATGG